MFIRTTLQRLFRISVPEPEPEPGVEGPFNYSLKDWIARIKAERASRADYDRYYASIRHRANTEILNTTLVRAIPLGNGTSTSLPSNPSAASSAGSTGAGSSSSSSSSSGLDDRREYRRIRSNSGDEVEGRRHAESYLDR